MAVLNLAGFRMISPTGTDDNYEAKSTGTNQRERGEQVRKGVYDALAANGSMNVVSLMKATGGSQGGIHGIMTKMKKDKVVKMTKNHDGKATKPTNYYELIKGADNENSHK